MNIRDKVVIITGGTGKNSLIVVRALLEKGAKYVAIFDLDSVEARGKHHVQILEDEFGSGRVGYYSCDVTDSKVFAARYDEIVGSMRSVDVLINNADILCENEIEKEINVNFKGLVSSSLIAIDRMGKHHNGIGGTIVNISSIAGLTAHPCFPVYSATKYAVCGFTKALKEYEKLLGVRVMAICQGFNKNTSSDLTHQKNAALNFVSKEMICDIYKRQSNQSPENLASAVISQIESGEAGSIWISDSNANSSILSDTNYEKKCASVTSL